MSETEVTPDLYVMDPHSKVETVDRIDPSHYVLMRARFLGLLQRIASDDRGLPAGVSFVVLPYRRTTQLPVLRIDWKQLVGKEFYCPEAQADWMESVRGHCLPLQAYLTNEDPHAVTTHLEAWQFADYVLSDTPALWQRHKKQLDPRWERRFSALRRRLHVWWTAPGHEQLRSFVVSLHRGVLSSVLVGRDILRRQNLQTDGTTVSYLSIPSLFALRPTATLREFVPHTTPSPLAFTGAVEAHALAHCQRTGVIVEGPYVLIYLPTYIRTLADQEHSVPWLGWPDIQADPDYAYKPGRPLRAVDLMGLRSKVRNWFVARIPLLAPNITEAIWQKRSAGRPFVAEDVIGISAALLTRFFFDSTENPRVLETRQRLQTLMTDTPTGPLCFVWPSTRVPHLRVSDLTSEPAAQFHERLLKHLLVPSDPQPRTQAGRRAGKHVWTVGTQLFCRYDTLLALYPEWDPGFREFIQQKFSQPYPGGGRALQEWANPTRFATATAKYDTRPFDLNEDQLIFERAKSGKLLTGYELQDLQKLIPFHSLNALRRRMYLWKFLKAQAVTPEIVRAPNWVSENKDTVPDYLKTVLAATV